MANVTFTPSGETVARERRGLPVRPYIPLIPPATVLLLFFAIPIGMMIGLSFQASDAPGITLDSYATFAGDSLAQQGALRTLVMSLLVAVLVTAMAYPVAYFLARSSAWYRPVVFALAIAPELAGVVLRTYGWLILLDDGGLINRTLLAVGLVSEPLQLTKNMLGVVIGLTHVLLPFGVLSLLTSIQSIDPNLEKSAQILGASRLSVLRHVVLPLSLPGIISSVLIAFTLAASAYATPALLGGENFDVLATMIYEQILYYVNWPYGAMMANILLIAVLLIAFSSARIESRLHEKLHIAKG
jgi:putative spermidine/putrescine transport system permease protein